VFKGNISNARLNDPLNRHTYSDTLNRPAFPDRYKTWAMLNLDASILYQQDQGLLHAPLYLASCL